MCGISGLINCGDAQTQDRMTSVQAHRGPDDSGLWERHFPDGTYIGLGSRRLAILDLSSGGHMPMSNHETSNDEGSIWITYNGEIYNFADLRRELESKGPFELVYERYSLWSYAGMEFARHCGVPGLLARGARIADQLDAATRDGLVLAPDTVKAIGAAEARRNRWTTVALWVIAALLAWLVIWGL